MNSVIEFIYKLRKVAEAALVNPHSPIPMIALLTENGPFIKLRN